MKPCNGNILIRPIIEGKTESGIIMPEDKNRTPAIGEVIAVGPGDRKEDGTRHEMCVKEGDHVFMQEYKVHQIEFEGEQLIFATEQDILAII